jgi:hypothetical protein
MEKRFAWKYRKDLKNSMEHMFYYYYIANTIWIETSGNGILERTCEGID